MNTTLDNTPKADIHIAVRRDRAVVSGVSRAGCTWIRRNMVAGCSQPVRVSAEGVPDIVAQMKTDRLEVVVR